MLRPYAVPCIPTTAARPIIIPPNRKERKRHKGFLKDHSYRHRRHVEKLYGVMCRQSRGDPAGRPSL